MNSFKYLLLVIISSSWALENEKKNWWRYTNIYEVYIRSFKDSDGDGIGDIKGKLALKFGSVNAIFAVCCLLLAVRRMLYETTVAISFVFVLWKRGVNAGTWGIKESWSDEVDKLLKNMLRHTSQLIHFLNLTHVLK